MTLKYPISINKGLYFNLKDKKKLWRSGGIMIVPMIVSGITAGTIAALTSLYFGVSLVFSAGIYVLTGTLAFIFSAIIFSLRFIISKIWWSLDIDIRINIIIFHTILASPIFFAWVIFTGVNGNALVSLIYFAVGAISIPAWLSYAFDNLAARNDANFTDDYL